MDIRQLEYFVAIARFGGFRKAANELNLSQATLSEKIKQLELELRVPLFERSSRLLALTGAGETLLERAERVLFEMKAAREEMLEYTDLDRGSVAVGIQSPSGLFSWMPSLIAAFRERYPHVEISLIERNYQQLLDALRDAELHVVWVLVPDGIEVDSPGLTLQRLDHTELVLGVPLTHRLAGRATVTLDELRDEPLILPRVGEPTRAVLDRTFRAAGFEPNVFCEVTDPITLVGLAAKGLGIAVSSENVIRHSDPGMSVLRLQDVSMTYALALGWRDRGARTKAVAAFVDFAQTWQHSVPQFEGPGKKRDPAAP